jgi:hypothetical protein
MVKFYLSIIIKKFFFLLCCEKFSTALDILLDGEDNRSMVGCMGSHASRLFYSSGDIINLKLSKTLSE